MAIRKSIFKTLTVVLLVQVWSQVQILMAMGTKISFVMKTTPFRFTFSRPEGHVFSGITFPSYETQIGVLDYNGDGLPDIALLTSSYYTSGKLYQNRGIVDGALKFEMIRSDLPSEKVFLTLRTLTMMVIRTSH